MNKGSRFSIQLKEQLRWTINEVARQNDWNAIKEKRPILSGNSGGSRRGGDHCRDWEQRFWASHLGDWWGKDFCLAPNTSSNLAWNLCVQKERENERVRVRKNWKDRILQGAARKDQKKSANSFRDNE